jgi:hypothetical protein
VVRESEHLRFLRDLLFKILPGIVSLPGGGAVANAHRFTVRNKGNEEGNEWREKRTSLFTSLSSVQKYKERPVSSPPKKGSFENGPFELPKSCHVGTRQTLDCGGRLQGVVGRHG